jgi:phage replication O-like protein O
MKRSGFTQVDNAFLDKLISCDLTSLELKVVLAIYRKTFGYQQKTAPLSSGYLSKITGATRRSILRAVLGLRKKNVVLKDLVHSLRNKIASYELNTALFSWKVSDAGRVELSQNQSLEYAGSDLHYQSLDRHTILKKYKISREQFDEIFAEFVDFIAAEGRKYVDYPAQFRRWLIREAKENKFEMRLGYARH